MPGFNKAANTFFKSWRTWFLSAGLWRTVWKQGAEAIWRVLSRTRPKLPLLCAKGGGITATGWLASAGLGVCLEPVLRGWITDCVLICGWVWGDNAHGSLTQEPKCLLTDRLSKTNPELYQEEGWRGETKDRLMQELRAGSYDLFWES